MEGVAERPETAHGGAPPVSTPGPSLKGRPTKGPTRNQGVDKESFLFDFKGGSLPPRRKKPP